MKNTPTSEEPENADSLAEDQESDDAADDETDDALDVSRQAEKQQKLEAAEADKADANQEIEKVGKKSNLYFAVMAGAVILGFILLFTLPPLFNPERSLTLDEMHDKNLERKLPPEQGYLYNGFSFVSIEDSWFTRFKHRGTGQEYSIQLRYGPRELQHVAIQGNASTLLKYNATYITFDPTGENLSYVALAAADLSLNLHNVLHITPVAACTKNETEGCKNRPIVTCEGQYPAIMVHSINLTPGVYARGSCIVVRGEGLGLLEAVDRLLLEWYGIMPS